MTARSPRNVVEWLLAGGAAVLISLGATYGATRATIAEKLDTRRFEVDSAARATRDSERERQMFDWFRRLEDGQRETNARLRELSCPPSARGCR